MVATFDEVLFEIDGELMIVAELGPLS